MERGGMKSEAFLPKVMKVWHNMIQRLKRTAALVLLTVPVLCGAAEDIAYAAETDKRVYTDEEEEYIKKAEKEKKEVTKVAECPKCHKDIIERRTKRGKIFYGCSGYPKCDYATWYKPTGDVCPKCGNLIVNKNGFDVCENCEKEEKAE